MNGSEQNTTETVVLIAEDDDAHFSLITNILRREGVSNEIIRFTDGQETLNYLFDNCSRGRDDQSKDYILILDILMPKMNGSEVLGKMKQNSRLIDIPVIVLTSMDDPDERKYCINAGCSIYIVKPMEYDDFVIAIKKISTLITIAG